MQAASEDAFLQELLAGALAPNEASKNRGCTPRQKSWLIRLPLVYNEDSTQHFEEQLVLSLDTLTRWLSEVPASDLRYVRSRVCVRQLQDVATKRTQWLQDLSTAMQAKS